MICFTSSLIRKLYNFDRVLLQLVGTDIENSLFKYRVSYRHLTFMIETFELLMKSYRNLTCYSCIFNVQLHVHLKKWTLKFRPLYLRNYASYFNKICKVSSVKVWKFGSNPYYHNWNTAFFSRGLFFIGAPCILIYKTMVRSHLDYCCCVWTPYKKGDIEALQKVQKRATKILPSLRHLRYSERLKKCKLTTPHYRQIRDIHTQQISSQYLLWFKNYNHLNLKVQFSKWTST